VGVCVLVGVEVRVGVGVLVGEGLAVAVSKTGSLAATWTALHMPQNPKNRIAKGPMSRYRVFLDMHSSLMIFIIRIFGSRMTRMLASNCGFFGISHGRSERLAATGF